MHIEKKYLNKGLGKSLLFSFVFFVCFYRISLLHSSIYISILIGVMTLPSFIKSSNRKFFIKSISPIATVFFLMLVFYSLLLDLFTGSLFHYFSSSFAVRFVFMLVCSILPAYFIVFNFLKGSSKLLIRIMMLAFLLQTVFFFLSFMSPEVKIFLYDVMGAGGSVNLKNWNMGTRGFGLSNEINFSSPFLMVVLSLYFFKSVLLKLLLFLTQVVNSNNTVTAAILGLMFSKYKPHVKIILVIISTFFLLKFSIDYLPRLTQEFSHGGANTIMFLLDKHFYALNEGVLEWLSGTGIYIYGGASEHLSDMGFVIIFNYGGVLFSLLFSAMLFLLVLKVGYSKGFICLWALVGVVLNLKGLLLGANGYVFMTFLFLFNNYYRKGVC